MEHTFDSKYWDQIWTGERAEAMGSGQPNPHLMREVQDMTPGTALDAGCGAGLEAIWLATHGWQVTGADIATAALERAAERATTAGLAEQLKWIQADLSTWEPDNRYDLVTTHYAHPAMPQLEFYDRIATWVAPGGTLLIVGHLHRENNGLTTGHGPGHGSTTERSHGSTAEPAHGRHHEPDGGEKPPASASATAVIITARLDPTRWEILTAQESSRTLTGPDGHKIAIHDVVVRATRRH